MTKKELSFLKIGDKVSPVNSYKIFTVVAIIRKNNTTKIKVNSFRTGLRAYDYKHLKFAEGDKENL